ncbi:MAG: hypothetical protein ACI86H_003073, partial [bacterium]
MIPCVAMPDMEEIIVSQLYVYPIKSAQGIALTEAIVGKKGFQYDRRWMLVDENGSFLSQRKYPQMASLEVQFAGEGLSVSAPNMSSLLIPFEPMTKELLDVQVWDDIVSAVIVGNDSNVWFSKFLGIKSQLVFFPEEEFRQVDQEYAEPQHGTGFSDGFPFLLISEASLDDLNSRLEEPVTMERFRPNIVVQGCNAFEEDFWKEVQIGNITFSVVKPCSRCIITTLDPKTGKKIGKEPLKTLSSYRKVKSQVYFGQNIVQH